MNESWRAHNGHLRDEENLTIEPCPICGAEREQRTDGHLIHAVFTKETWALHEFAYRHHEEEVKQSIIQERALRGGEKPELNPPLGGWYS